jgi:hypothetical protein
VNNNTSNSDREGESMGNLLGGGGKWRSLSGAEHEALSSFRNGSATVKRILGKYFKDHYSETEAHHQVRKWISNIAANLDAASNSIRRGVDRHGDPMSIERVGEGLIRMCDDYLASPYMIKLERCMGTGIRDEVKHLVISIKEVAERLSKSL